MKKKLLALFLAASMTLTAGVLLTACGGDAEPVHTTHYDVDADGKCDKCGEDMADHTHIFSVKWDYDETSHWHKATCAHEDAVGGKEEHNFVNSVCTVCKALDTAPVAPVEGVYSFEAENAELDDKGAASNTMVVEVDRREFTEPGDNTGPLVTNVGYFGGSEVNAGQTITWKFTAAKAGEVTLKLRASSAVGDWAGRKITAIEMGTDGAPTLAVNDEVKDLAGQRIGETRSDFTQDDMQSGRAYSNFTELEITVQLVAGTNTVVFTSGTLGCNPDKIMIETDIELTFIKTNNNNRIAA